MGWAGIAIGALTLIFMITTGILGLLWKGAKEIGRIGQKLEDIAEDSKKTTESLDRHIQWHLKWHLNRRGIGL